MKITSHIFQVGGSDLSHPADAAVYLIADGGHAALVDAGTGKGTQRVRENISASGISMDAIDYIFITHCHFDHTGGIESLRSLCPCKVVAHELDAAFLEDGDSIVTAARWYGTHMEPVKIDIKVEGARQDFTLGGLEIAFLHAPGHSPGSSVLTVRSDGRLVLFGQDVHGPLNDVLRSSRSDYIRSLEFLISLDADILCEGHFGVFQGKDTVRRFIESFL